MATLYMGTDMRLALKGRSRLKDDRGEPVTGATVEATLYHAGGTEEVAGVTWPLTLSEEGEDGEYSATIPADVDVVTDKSYTMVLTATSPGGTKAKWRETVKARYSDF